MVSLEEIRNQLQAYNAQRAQTQKVYEQLCGAIHVLEEQMKGLLKKEEQAKAKAEMDMKLQEAQDDKDLAELNEPMKEGEGHAVKEG